MGFFYQIIANGLHNGFLYAILAYSYVLLHQVVPKPNLAHGAFFALAGQVFTMAVTFAYNALIFTFAASLGFGVGTHRAALCSSGTQHDDCDDTGSCHCADGGRSHRC
jgi:branched-chain amino acid transport system permease protein